MLPRHCLLLLPSLVMLAWGSFGNPHHSRVNHASEITIIPAGRDQLTASTSDSPTALARRTENAIPMISCKEVWRHQQYAVLPTAVGAATLQAFWNQIQRRSTYDEFFHNPKPLFTVTQGALQATFSCLGQAVPWDFVHDFAMNAADSAAQGLLETFDVVYEQELTGMTVWVSLRVVERLSAKRKRPG